MISAEPTSLLQNEEPIELPAARSVTVSFALPAELRTKPEVLLEGVLSAAPDPDESLDTARGKVKVGPVLIATRGHEDAEIHFEIPPEMAGRPGRLTVLARAVSAGTDLYDETLLVPLMIRGPGIAPGVEVEPQVGLVDLTPTILDLAQVRTPIAMQGRSFARLLTGRGTAFEERPVVSEVLHGLDGGTAGAAAPVRSVRTRTAKYMRTLGGERLYDLTTDPAESRNRMADQPSVAAEARRVLDEQAAACARSGAEAQPEEWDPRGLPAWLTDGRLNALDRLGQAKRKLESLGYVD